MSYSLVNSCNEIKRVEQGIPFDPYLLLKHDLAEQNALYEQSLADFEARVSQKRAKIEHSILNRLNCHKEKFDALYKVFNQRFVDKNRYPDMLPFSFNRVKLDTIFRPFQAVRRRETSSFDGMESLIKKNTNELNLIEQLPVFQRYSNRPASQTMPKGASPGSEYMQAPISTDDEFDDYINASWVDSCLKKQLIIAASAPKKNTAADFLHMIMENNVKLVMKVCGDKVNNREQCFKYTGKEEKEPKLAKIGSWFAEDQDNKDFPPALGKMMSASSNDSLTQATF